MAQRGYLYRVSLTPVSDPSGVEASGSLTFEHLNHDDLHLIVERVRGGLGLQADDAAAVAVGLKLLAEVVLRERENPLFEPLRSPLRTFTQELKRKVSEVHSAA